MNFLVVLAIFSPIISAVRISPNFFSIPGETCHGSCSKPGYVCVDHIEGSYCHRLVKAGEACTNKMYGDLTKCEEGFKCGAVGWWSEVTDNLKCIPK